MRYILYISVLSLVLLGGLVALAVAAPPDQSATVTVTATIKPTFGMMVGSGGVGATMALDASSASVTADPGNTVTQARVVTVKSNFSGGNPWQLQVRKAQDLTDATQAPPQIIPLPSFTHTSMGGAGSHTDATDTTFSLVSTTYYTATRAEQTNLPFGTPITTLLKMVVPPNQAAGTYSNVLTFTLISP
jgi:hypothetical protein